MKRQILLRTAVLVFIIIIYVTFKEYGLATSAVGQRYRVPTELPPNLPVKLSAPAFERQFDSVPQQLNRDDSHVIAAIPAVATPNRSVDTDIHVHVVKPSTPQTGQNGPHEWTKTAKMSSEVIRDVPQQLNREDGYLQERAVSSNSRQLRYSVLTLKKNLSSNVTHSVIHHEHTLKQQSPDPDTILPFNDNKRTNISDKVEDSLHTAQSSLVPVSNDIDLGLPAFSRSMDRRKLVKTLQRLIPSNLKHRKSLPYSVSVDLHSCKTDKHNISNEALSSNSLQRILNVTKENQGALRYSNKSTLMPSVFFSVKTATHYHSTRVPLLLVTWMQLVPRYQVHIVTDSYEDMWTKTAQQMGFNVVYSDCGKHKYVHGVGLCCKTSKEFAAYYSAIQLGNDFDWYCHFDDDTYVNIPALMDILKGFRPNEKPLYLGHFPSVRRVAGKVRSSVLKNYFPKHKGKPQFLFATGAAYCLSASLMNDLKSHLLQFDSICRNKLQIPDDMALAALVSVILGYQLTDIPEMLSHLEPLERIPQVLLHDLVTIGYKGMTSVCIQNATFTTGEDPSRFLSYHCLLNPKTSWCKRFE